MTARLFVFINELHLYQHPSYLLFPELKVHLS